MVVIVVGGAVDCNAAMARVDVSCVVDEYDEWRSFEDVYLPSALETEGLLVVGRDISCLADLTQTLELSVLREPLQRWVLLLVLLAPFAGVHVRVRACV